MPDKVESPQEIWVRVKRLVSNKMLFAIPDLPYVLRTDGFPHLTVPTSDAGRVFVDEVTADEHPETFNEHMPVTVDKSDVAKLQSDGRIVPETDVPLKDRLAVRLRFERIEPSGKLDAEGVEADLRELLAEEADSAERKAFVGKLLVQCVRHGLCPDRARAFALENSLEDTQP